MNFVICIFSFRFLLFRPINYIKSSLFFPFSPPQIVSCIFKSKKKTFICTYMYWLYVISRGKNVRLIRALLQKFKTLGEIKLISLLRYIIMKDFLFSLMENQCLFFLHSKALCGKSVCVCVTNFHIVS